MTRDETKGLLMAISMTYPHFKPRDLTGAIDIWWRILENDDPQLIMDAFSAYARTDTSGFAPSPGQLRMMIVDRTADVLTDGEIVALLSMAARNANYGFKQEFDRLPADLKKAVGSPTTIRSWGMMEQSQVEYAFNNIVKAYHNVVARRKFDTAVLGLSLGRIQRKELPFADDTPVLFEGESSEFEQIW